MMASVSENVFFLRLECREGKILCFLDYLSSALKNMVFLY